MEELGGVITGSSGAPHGQANRRAQLGPHDFCGVYFSEPVIFVPGSAAPGAGYRDKCIQMVAWYGGSWYGSRLCDGKGVSDLARREPDRATNKCTVQNYLLEYPIRMSYGNECCNHRYLGVGSEDEMSVILISGEWGGSFMCHSTFYYDKVSRYQDRKKGA